MKDTEDFLCLPASFSASAGTPIPPCPGTSDRNGNAAAQKRTLQRATKACYSVLRWLYGKNSPLRFNRPDKPS